MGFFSSSPRWVSNPASQGLQNEFRDWTAGQGLGRAGQQAKGFLKHFANGNYDSDPTIGVYLAPLRDQYSTMQRESNRAFGMGGLGMASGSQPALMARLKMLNEQQIAEQQGQAYANYLPQLYSQQAGIFQNAQNSRRQAELAGMSGAMQAANMGTWYQPKSIMDNLLSLGQLGGQAVGLATGLGAFNPAGLPAARGLPGTSQFYNLINSVPHY
jgi:hypothetical protein